jgi:hypothetical protein
MMSEKRLALGGLAALAITCVLVVALFLALAATVSGQSDRYVDYAGGCGGHALCYTTIVTAVEAAEGGDTIYVYPGGYTETVNLGNMAWEGDITLITVDAAGDPSPGTAYGVEIKTPYPGSFWGSITIDGFRTNPAAATGIKLVNVSGDVEIANVTATGHASYNIVVSMVGGNVTVENTTANGSWGTVPAGLLVSWVTGQTTVADSTFDNNEGYGMDLSNLSGETYVRNCSVSGTTDGGPSAYGSGIAVNMVGADVVITGSVIGGNSQYGVWYGSVTAGGLSTLLNGNTFCDNTGAGVYTAISGRQVDATGNWWGCEDGPGQDGCDIIDGLGTVTDNPWINTVSAQVTPDPVLVGQPTVVRFQFSDSGKTVFLGQGPGDRRSPPFTVTTDNGTLNGVGFSVQAGINEPNGILAVTLVPDQDVTATVTLDGPCNLGRSIQVQVEPHRLYVPLVMRNY